MPDVGRQQAAQHADGRGLAAAVRAEKTEDLAAARPAGETALTTCLSPKCLFRPVDVDDILVGGRIPVAVPPYRLTRMKLAVHRQRTCALRP